MRSLHANLANTGPIGIAVALMVASSVVAWARSPMDQAASLPTYGLDDRHVIEDRGPPWSAIGRVDRRGGGFCSGTLIAPDQVLTAAHCLWDQRLGRWMTAEDLHFFAGYRLGGSVARSAVRAVRLHPDIDMDERGRPRDLVTDWAVLTLCEPVPLSDGLQPLVLPSAGENFLLGQGSELIRAGYSQDRPHWPTFVACRVVGRSGALLVLHGCDATFGESGAPFLVETETGWRLLALQIARVQRQQQTFGIGILMTVAQPNEAD